MLLNIWRYLHTSPLLERVKLACLHTEITEAAKILWSSTLLVYSCCSGKQKRRPASFDITCIFQRAEVLKLEESALSLSPLSKAYIKCLRRVILKCLDIFEKSGSLTPDCFFYITLRSTYMQFKLWELDLDFYTLNQWIRTYWY